MIFDKEPIFITTNCQKMTKCKNLLKQKDIVFEEAILNDNINYHITTYCIYVKGLLKYKAKSIIKKNEKFLNE